MILSNHAKGLLSVKKEVSHYFVNQLFPNFDKVFGVEEDEDDLSDDSQVLIKFITQFAPHLSISTDGIEINGTAILNIMNPLNKDIKAADIYFNFSTSLKAQIKEGLLVTGNLNNLDLEVNDVNTLFISEENVETIAVKMEGVKQMLFILMNQMLLEGVYVPLPQFFQDELTDSSLTQYDQYLLVEANTNVHEYLTQDNFLKIIS